MCAPLLWVVITGESDRVHRTSPHRVGTRGDRLAPSWEERAGLYRGVTMFDSLVPGGLLGESVALLWVYESDGPGTGFELRLPTGAVELTINLFDDGFWMPDGNGAGARFGGSVVAGPYQHAYVLDAAPPSHVVGVVLRPGRARALIDVPLCELANRHVALGDLWGIAAVRLRERLLHAPDGPARLRVLGAILHDRLTDSAGATHPLAAAAAGLLTRRPVNGGVGELGDRLGLTSRRVQQVFRGDLGLTPKSYQRLQRFRSVLDGIDEVGRVGWSVYAIERGYCDQAHLAREFHAHSGLSPTAYLRGRGTRLNHVPLVA